MFLADNSRLAGTLRISATFALLLATTGDPLVIPSLNRDGDLLSDMVLQMFGSIAGSESMVISLDDEGQVACVMATSQWPHFLKTRA